METGNCANGEYAYGEGAYSTCEFIGAPDTGFFQQVINNDLAVVGVAGIVAISIVLFYSLYRRGRQR